MKSKILFGVIFVILSFLALGKWIYGGTREISVGAPENFYGKVITFNVPMYYQIGEPTGPTPILKKIGRQIVPNQEHCSYSSYCSDRFRYEIVATSTKYSIVDTVHVANYGLKSIDSGSDGIYFYILQDENGGKSFVSTYRFNYYISFK